MAQRVSVQLPGHLRAVAVGDVAPGPAWAGAALAMQAQPEEGPQEQVEQARKEIEAERRRLQQACKALAGAVQQLQHAQAELAAKAEEQLLALALDIARKVLAQEIQAGRYEIDPIVTEALRQLPARCDVTVRLHPDDHAQCKAALELGGDSESIRFVADANVLRGECFLETSEGTVDAGVETQLGEIAEALRQPE